jgi:tetratricopeptide (TPR) repeat protein
VEASDRKRRTRHSTGGLRLSWLGVVYQHLGSSDSAIDAHHKGIALLYQTQSRGHLNYAINRLAETYREQGHFGDAVQQYQRARTVAHEIGDLWAEATILMELGQAQKAEGQDTEARQSWQLALSIFEEFSDTRANRLRVLLTELDNQKILFLTPASRPRSQAFLATPAQAIDSTTP